MIARRLSSLSVVVVFVGLILAAVAGSAAADPGAPRSYTLKSCDASTQDQSSFGPGWQLSGYGTGVFPDKNCPDGIVFDGEGPFLDPPKWGAWFAPQTTSIVESAEFIYYGGDTSGAYRYWVKACPEDECAVVKELTPGASEAVPTQVKLGLSSHQSSTMAIVGECVVAICPDPTPFVFKNFLFEYSDDVTPTISDLEVTPTGADDPDSDVWLDGKSMTVSFNAYDDGSGVAGVFIFVDQPNGTNATPEPCDFDDSGTACPQWVHVTHKLDLSNVTSGNHIVRIVIYDWALSFPYYTDLPIRIDREAPDEPTGLTLDDGVTQWGWTSQPIVRVGHDDPTDTDDFTHESGWASASFDLRPGANGAVAQSADSTFPDGTMDLTFPHEGAWDVGVAYRDRAGNTGNRAHRFVGYDAGTPQPADPEPIGWIKLSSLIAGINQTWTPPPADAELESGICGYSFTADDEPLGIPPAEPNVLAPTTHARIGSELGEGKHYAHLRAVACNGNASSTETTEVNVDGTAPVPSLHGLQTDGWMTTPPNFSLSAADAGSGTASLEYGFAGPSSLQLHLGSAKAITVPEGATTFTYRATDLVGNESPIQTREIRADWSGPSVEFRADDLARPNQVSATVADPHSGLASVAMQIRRTDDGANAVESAWHSLGASETIAPEGRKELSITKSIPDGDLAPGQYAVRVSARDVAGNWSDTTTTKQFSLPLRAGTTISAAIAKVGDKSRVNWSGASQDRVLRYGTRTALVGTLQDASGNPIPGARLAITETPEFGVERAFGETTTNTSGEFVAKLPSGVTRTFTVRFDGSDGLRPAAAVATIRVRAALTFKLSKKRVRSGRPFTFSGRLLSGDLGTPEGGKFVTVEYLYKREWRPTAATPQVDSKGRFKRQYPGITATRATTVYFRATARREGSWPFLTGSSKIVALRVIP
ncbi:MAG: carboxypeptidase regulatory-like domain-containing protein [Thermoleophilaceae bacterium]|nr:carboxypeptidase regulatory-like domain-containing protein [Thermoleophilaceae bacterium]